MGDSESVVVLKQGDWVLWQDGDTSGVGRIATIDEGIAHYSTYVYIVSPESYGNPLGRPDKVMHLSIEHCTKIDPAIAKIYGHNNV